MKRSMNNKLDMVTLPDKKSKVNIFNRDVKYLKVKDVKRAYSKLIQDFCKGTVSNDDAKTVAYLFSGYLQLIRDVEFEQRLNQLEEKVSDEKL